MNEYEGILSLSKQKLKQADHIVSVTHLLLKEPKLLLSSLDTLFDAVCLAMKALLNYEKSRRSIPIFGDSFSAQFSVFATRIVPKYGISKNYVTYISLLKEFLDHHKRSRVEFRRNQSYVMADDDYEMKELTSDLLKEQLAFAKMFITEISLILIREQEHSIEPEMTRQIHRK